MFNSLGNTPSRRVTARQPPHNSHRCPSFQVQRKAPSSPKSTPPLDHFESKNTEFTDPHFGRRQAATSRITPCYPISKNSGSTNYPSLPTLEQKGDPLEPELPRLPNPHSLRRNHAPNIRILRPHIPSAHLVQPQSLQCRNLLLKSRPTRKIDLVHLNQLPAGSIHPKRQPRQIRVGQRESRLLPPVISVPSDPNINF